MEDIDECIIESLREGGGRGDTRDTYNDDECGTILTRTNKNKKNTSTHDVNSSYLPFTTEQIPLSLATAAAAATSLIARPDRPLHHAPPPPPPRTRGPMITPSRCRVRRASTRLSRDPGEAKTGRSTKR